MGNSSSTRANRLYDLFTPSAAVFRNLEIRFVPNFLEFQEVHFQFSTGKFMFFPDFRNFFHQVPQGKKK